MEIGLRNDVHLKTIEHLKESKQINNNCFLGVVGRRVGFRASKLSQMDQHGPTWSQKDTKREPKATQMEPKGDQKSKKKQCSEKVGSRSLRPAPPGNEKSIFSRKWRPKGAFLEIPKIENGTKTARLTSPLVTLIKSGLVATKFFGD